MQYDWNAGETSATFETFPKGDYEVTVGEPKAFIRTKANSEESTWGIRFMLRFANGANAGKRTSYNAYLTGENPFVKQLLMAGNGFSIDPNGEREFEEFAAGYDWKYDVQSGEVGSGWRTVTGKNVIAVLDVQPGKGADQDKTFQQYKGFRRVEA